MPLAPRPRTGALTGLVLALLGAGCGDDEDPAGARDLLRRVRQDDYRSWRRAPGYEERQPAASPHADRVDIFINDVIADALDAGEPLDAWPIGSIIVKDGYSDGELELRALMEKRSSGKWFWAEFFGSDSEYSGTPEVCLDCHEAGGDYVFAFPLP